MFFLEQLIIINVDSKCPAFMELDGSPSYSQEPNGTQPELV
jgi:hypothetical protein